MPDHAAFERQFVDMLLGRTIAETQQLGRALSIHRNTAFKAAADALAASYPVLRSLCGEEPFTACAHDYVVRKPPRDPRLCLYGADFARFIAAYEPFSSLSWLPDIVCLERFCVEALFASDAVALDSAAILAVLERGQTSRLHPAVRFGRFGSPAASIWLAHQEASGPDALGRIGWTPETVLVTRPADALLVMPIDAGAAAFLGACADGAGFGDAASAAAEAGADVAITFSTLITAGAFA